MADLCDYCMSKCQIGGTTQIQSEIDSIFDPNSSNELNENLSIVVERYLGKSKSNVCTQDITFFDKILNRTLYCVQRFKLSEEQIVETGEGLQLCMEIARNHKNQNPSLISNLENLETQILNVIIPENKLFEQ